jgi:hypothetical protein
LSTKRIRSFGTVLGVTLFLAASLAVSAWQLTAQTIPIDNDDLAGVVTGPNGPEAGVWVIAETTDLPTRLAKIVVTDDQGRYLLPDLPSASYQVWVRGYGLVDSPKVGASPGANLNLTAVMAPDPLAAAQYYPAGYWFSLLQIPGKEEFPGTGRDGNGISPNVRSQAEWLRFTKSGGCVQCHAIGNKATREIPEALGHFETSLAAWDRRVQSGQAAANMMSGLNDLGRERALAMFADWSDRIAAGAVPPAPPRPQGVERNVVIMQWDWADPKAYFHDQVSTDRRNPTVNAYGPIYGSLELSADYTPVLDPMRNIARRIELTVRDPNTRPAAPQQLLEPSPYWGDEPIWTSKNNVHNPMLDQNGRLWLTSTVRPPENPAFCREGSSHPSAQAFPVNTAGRHLAMYDPATGSLTHISTCFSTHHLMFAEDADNTLWTSGGGAVAGWLNTRMFLETGDEEASQGWTPLILDTNGNGQRDAFVGPTDAVDPDLDKQILAPFYGIATAPDGMVWASFQGSPGGIVRLNPGPNPSETALAELYELPWNNPNAPTVGYSPRGMDVDRNGVVWTPLASGHMASFDRRKCQGPLNGPAATGQQCPEGWALYPEPIPQFSNVTDPGSAEASYYTWVDRFNSFGLGNDVPINTGNGSEGFLALKDGQWVTLRVPYPLGFYAKWMDGRIDDANAGWKGRGLWATYSSRAPFHMETGKGTMPRAMHFQLRPDPLAK